VGAVMMVIYNKIFQPGTRDLGLGTRV